MTAYEMRISDWSSDVCSSDLIVDLVRAGVVEILALEVNLCAKAFAGVPAQMLGQPFGEPQRARTADIIFQQIVELGLERRIGLRGAIVALEVEEQRHQRFGSRKRVVQGRSVAVRVELVGGGVI